MIPSYHCVGLFHTDRLLYNNVEAGDVPVASGKSANLYSLKSSKLLKEI
jgi:hypothetical protein